jgi:hypothetical protein
MGTSRATELGLAKGGGSGSAMTPTVVLDPAGCSCLRETICARSIRTLVISGEPEALREENKKKRAASELARGNEPWTAKNIEEQANAVTAI